MRKRPLPLILCASVFFFFPIETLFRYFEGKEVALSDFLFSLVLPLVLMVGLIKVARFGWYTLVMFGVIWGVRDLYDYYGEAGTLRPLLVHLVIYFSSLIYFINPRVRHLYFDPKMRWWRTKRRYETHLPFIMKSGDNWYYPILRNVSEGGCFVETPHPLELNTPIQVAIPLPVPLGVPVIRANAEVRWVSHHQARIGMGVQFTDLIPSHLRAVKLYVHKGL